MKQEHLCHSTYKATQRVYCKLTFSCWLQRTPKSLHNACSYFREKKKICPGEKMNCKGNLYLFPEEIWSDVIEKFLFALEEISRNMNFPTMWYLRPAKPQIRLRVRAV